jgi:TatD DNase family protein
VLPLDRILVETDSPYLAPVPHRGKLNQPALVKHVAEEVARLRGDSFENISRATSENFFRLFRLVPNEASKT